MNYNYNPMVKTAERLLAKYGLEAISTVNDDRFIGKALRDKINGNLATRFHNLVEEQDILLICSADLQLEDDCIVEYDGCEWFIVKANPVKPGDMIVMYEAIARLL